MSITVQPYAMKNKTYLTIQDVADLMNVNVFTVYRWAKRRAIPAVQIDKKTWRVDPDELDRFMRGGDNCPSK